jgi:hypothetical protein
MSSPTKKARVTAIDTIEPTTDENKQPKPKKAKTDTNDFVFKGQIRFSSGKRVSEFTWRPKFGYNTVVKFQPAELAGMTLASSSGKNYYTFIAQKGSELHAALIKAVPEPGWIHHPALPQGKHPAVIAVENCDITVHVQEGDEVGKWKDDETAFKALSEQRHHLVTMVSIKGIPHATQRDAVQYFGSCYAQVVG